MQIQYYFGAEIKTAILEALNQAEKEVFIAVFIFNHTELINALRECCQRNVKLIYCLIRTKIQKTMAILANWWILGFNFLIIIR